MSHTNPITDTVRSFRRSTTRPAEASGTFFIGGDIPVRRLGFGTMRLTGAGIWGEPGNHSEAIAVLQRAVELGINLLDTADSYGPHVSEELIADALHPYPSDLVIATKGGFARPGPDTTETPHRCLLYSPRGTGGSADTPPRRPGAPRAGTTASREVVSRRVRTEAATARPTS